MVQVDGQQYRRNRIHLRQQATFPDRASTEPLNIRPWQLDTLPDQTPADPQYTPIQTCTSQTHEIQPRRSSRPVQVPARLKEHDLSKGRRTKQKKIEKEEKKKRKKHIGTLLWLRWTVLASFNNELAHYYKVWTFTASHIYN